MSQEKSTIKKNYQDKTLIDSILWFIENYLPQKKKKSSPLELRLHKFELFNIYKIKKLASVKTKSLRGDLSGRKVTFIVGNWALPYLNLFKRIKLLK